MFILGVPKHNPDANMLIRCPTSGFARAGLGDWGGGPWGTHSPFGHAWAGEWDGCLGGTHPPPLGKVTSWSSLLGFPLPDGSSQGVGWGLLGCVCSSQSAISWWRSFTNWCSSWSVRLPNSAWRQCRVPHLGEGYQWVNEIHPPPLRLKIMVWRVFSHYGNIPPYVVLQRSHGSKWQWACPTILLPLWHHVMLIASPLLYITEPLIPLVNTRAHPRGKCAPASCIFLQCLPLTQRWHWVEYHLSLSLSICIF